MAKVFLWSLIALIAIMFVLAAQEESCPPQGDCRPRYVVLFESLLDSKSEVAATEQSRDEQPIPLGLGIDSILTSVVTDLAEEKPPVVREEKLTATQIRYCLSERYRLRAMRRSVEPPGFLFKEQYNAAALDYNQRCGEYSYT